MPILGKVLQRPSQWFNKPLGIKAWVMCRCFNGMPGLRPVAHQLTMTNTQGDPQAAQLLKLLHEFKSSSVRISVGPFTTLLRWKLVMGRASGFWRRNWVCTVSQPNLCPGSWQLTRSSSASASALNWTEKQKGCHPPPTVLPWFGTLWLFRISKNEIEVKRMPVWYHWGDTGWIAESAWHSDRKGLPGSVPEMEEMVGPVSTCRRELLRGWWRLIGLMVSFTIFTASVWKIVDTTL